MESSINDYQPTPCPDMALMVRDKNIAYDERGFAEFKREKERLGELLSPKSDYIFKRIFGNESHIEILKNFLNSVLDLHGDEIASITLGNPQHDKMYKREKMTIFDIKAITKSEVRIDIELQKEKISIMAERAIFYSSRMLHEQLQSGGKYDNINRAVTIVIADFNFIDDSAHYHNCYKYYDKKNNSTLSNITEIHVLELQKLCIERDGELWDWMKFISTKSKEEFKMLAKNNKHIEPAVTELEKLSRDTAARYATWREEKEWRDQQGRLDAARIDGREEAIFEVARKFKKNGVSTEIIQKSTGLSKSEIDE